LAFIQGFGLQHGALASSVAHDSITLSRLERRRFDLQGSQQHHHDKRRDCRSDAQWRRITAFACCRTHDDLDGDWVASRYAELDRLANKWDPICVHLYDAVLYGAAGDPNLKLSDQGLFDSRTFHSPPDVYRHDLSILAKPQ